MFRQADGSLLCEGFPVRECVMPYVQADGSVIREYVPASTIRESADGLARLPVTLHHPTEDVTPDNVKALGVGDTDGRIDLVGGTPKEWEAKGGYVRVGFAVRARDALDAIDRGEVTELSPGYLATVEMRAGEHPVHGRYDAVQVRRQYNHLALVDAARGGSTIRFRADAGSAVAQRRHDAIDFTPAHRADTTNPGTSGGSMKPQLVALLSLLGVAHVDNEDAALREATDKARDLTKRATDAEAACAAAEEEMDKAKADKAKADTTIQTLTGERDAYKAKADAADKAAADAADKAERDALAPLVARHKIDGADKLELPALRRAIAKADLGKIVTDATPDQIVTGMVQALLAGTKADSDRADAWKPEDLGGGRRDRDEAPASPTQTYYDAADAAFRAARGDAPAIKATAGGAA